MAAKRLQEEVALPRRLQTDEVATARKILRKEEFTVGWICALTKEYVAARQFLDKEYDKTEYTSALGDNNTYTFGQMGMHNVVIAVMPQGEYGTTSAATVARDLVRSFPNLRIGLMVGIGGAAPSRAHDIRLGDVVVGSPCGGQGGVYQYDFGKTIQDQKFQHNGHLNQPPNLLLTAVADLAARIQADGHEIGKDIEAILSRKRRLQKDYSQPDVETDCLYRATCVHLPGSEGSCEASCARLEDAVLSRPARGEDDDNPTIHYGLIASANQLMKDAVVRDALANEMGILCFEMEAAGLMSHFPCLVIRGVCDYADSHENKTWQGFAAMTAAAYARRLLDNIAPNQVETEEELGDMLQDIQKTARDSNETVKKHDADQRSQQIDKWLSPPDPSINHNRAREQRHADTGRWLLHTDQYKNWKAKLVTSLWLHGIPGCGKTILTSTIIEDLKTDVTLSSSNILYFYFDFNDSSKQSLDNLVRSLISQLYQENDQYRKQIDALYSNRKNGREQPSTDALVDALQEIARIAPNLTLVLDALDECTTRKALLSWLNSPALRNLHVLLTSREEHDIETALSKQWPPITVVPIQHESVDDDIRAVVRDTIAEDEDLQRWKDNTEVCTEIEKTLMAKAGGMFRWAACQLNVLKDCRHLRSLREKLSSLSETLEGTYYPATVDPSDSGYNSVPDTTAKRVQGSEHEDDRETIVSEADTLEIGDHIRTEAIAIFVAELIHEIAYAGTGTSSNGTDLYSALLDAVQCFASTLGSSARPGIEANASTFFRQQRRRIVKEILAKLADANLSGFCHGDPLAEFPDHSPAIRSEQEAIEGVEEKLKRMWESNDQTAGDWASLYQKQMQELDNDENSESETSEYTNPYVLVTRSFVQGSLAYKWLVGKVQKTVKLTPGSGHITDYLKDVIHPSNLNAIVTFEVHWDPLEFLTDQYAGGTTQQLADVITLTECAGNFEAATCGQYLEQTWPFNGLNTLSALQSAINVGLQVNEKHHIVEGYIDFRKIGNLLKVTVNAPKLIAIEIGEQLCWLGAACRASTVPDRRSYFVPIITGSEQGQFVITFSEHAPEEGGHPTQGPANCWTELFRNPGIAKDFPIPLRDHFAGCLEIPLNMMAGLGYVERATVFDEQLMLKGFFTLLVPVERIGSTVVWHFLGDRDQKEIPYTKAFDDQTFSSRAALDFSCLSQSRHFVGWVSKALLRTGAREIDYRNIRYPKARLVGPGCALERVTLSGGQFITGGVSFAKGAKDEALCISYDGPYRQELSALQRSYVVFFDEQEKRGWLVDGASAVLHLLRAQLESEPFVNNGHLRIDRFKYSEKEDGPLAAYETLIMNRSLKVDEDEAYSRNVTWTGPGDSKRTDKADTKIWTVEQLVRQLMHFLGQIQTHQSKVTQTHLRGTTREKLEGWSAKDIIEAEKRLEPRVVTLTSSGRGWVDFTRSIGAVTLIGRGFGDLIIPQNPCSSWKRVPMGKNYLTTTVHVLRRICDKYGDDESTPLRLANGIYWHQAHQLFEPCQCSESGGGLTCDRVQVLLPRIRLGPTKRPDHFFQSAHSQGAVIFGKSARLKFSWSREGEPVEGEGSSDGDDSGIGTSLASSNIQAVPG